MRIKSLLPAACLFTFCATISQAQTVGLPVIGEATIVAPMAPLYKSLGDTTKNITYLTKGNTVQILDADDFYWVYVTRSKQQYFIGRPSLGMKPGPRALVTLEALKAIPRNPSNGEVYYSAVVQAEGMSQNDLYLRGKIWIINVFNSPKDVMTTEEKDVGIIICKGYTLESVQTLGQTIPVRMYFTVKMAAKEGRYKYDIMNIYFIPYATADNPAPEKISVQDCLNTAYRPNGKPYYLSQQYSNIIINKAALLEVNVRKALSKGEDW